MKDSQAHKIKQMEIRIKELCEIFVELGYRVRKIKNYTKTTIPFWYNYPNLIEGMAVTSPYQVLQTDITTKTVNPI